MHVNFVVNIVQVTVENAMIMLQRHVGTPDQLWAELALLWLE